MADVLLQLIQLSSQLHYQSVVVLNAPLVLFLVTTLLLQQSFVFLLEHP